MSCRSPNRTKVQQIDIDNRSDGFDVTERGNAPNYEPGMVADKICVRFFHALVTLLRQSLLIHPMGAAGHHE